jgi:hypothetical protein
MAAAHSCLSPFNAVDMDDIASSFQLGLSAWPFSLAFQLGLSTWPLQPDTPIALARQKPLSRRQLLTFLKRRVSTADLLEPQ